MTPLNLSTPSRTDTRAVMDLLGSLGFPQLASQFERYDRSDPIFAVNGLDLLGRVLEWESKRREEELKNARRLEACLPYPEAKLREPADGLTPLLAAKLMREPKAFVHHEKIIITGTVDSGKTFFACAIANGFIDYGHTVRFERAPAFFDNLLVEQKNGTLTLDKTWGSIMAYDLFILDDMEMLDFNPQIARLLQDLLAFRKSHTTLFISAVPTSCWGLNNEQPAVCCALKRLVMYAFQFHRDLFDLSSLCNWIDPNDLPY